MITRSIYFLTVPDDHTVIVYFDDFHDSFCDQGEFDVCYEMQRLVSEVTFPSFEGEEAFF